MGTLKRSILALSSSVLYILAFPNFNQSWLAWIALVPLVLAVSPTRRPAPSPSRSFLLGWLSGTLAYMGILYWIIVTFQAAHLSIFLAVLCLLLLAGYLGLYWAAWAWFLATSEQAEQGEQGNRRSERRLSTVRSACSPCSLALRYSIGGAAAWVALEYLRTYLFSGFPWALLADSQVRNLPLIQIASVTGVYGVSFLVVLVNLAIAGFLLSSFPADSGGEPIKRHHDGPPTQALGGDGWLGLAASLLMLIACFLFGLHRLHRPITPSLSRPIKVALLQGSIDQYKKWDKVYVEEIQKTYENLVTQAARSKPDMIIWPETSVPGYLLQEPSLHSWLTGVVRKCHASHLVGAPVMHEEMSYNSSLSLSPEGILLGEYAKQHLVPFGEVVPCSRFLGRFIRVLNDLGGFAAGKDSPVLRVGGVPVGVNICYEAIFPDLVRQSVRQGAVLIANLTNDGWYMQTSAPYQHWAPNIFRAVENDRWLVRADNTGISGIISPAGRVEAASAIFQPGVIEGTVQAKNGLTLYTRFGDIFAWICIIFCTGIFLRDILRA